MINALVITLLIVSIFYFFNILYFIFGIIKLKNDEYNNYTEPVSVIIAVYNGADSLNRLLHQLSNQIYSNKIEFIIVDDMSTDQTKEMIEKHVLNDNRFVYVASDEGSLDLSYKKRALDAGIKKSKYDILLFTDVDCEIGPKWVKYMVSKFSDNNVEYIVGFSYVHNQYITNLVSKFQQVDFFILMITAFSCLNNQKPWACTGQNQAYRKRLFNRVHGFSAIKNCLQGDDTLFMQTCNNTNNISFSYHPDSFIITRTEYNLLSFIKQRVRWAGDANIMWKFNKNLFIMIVSTFLINSFIIFLGFFVESKLVILILSIKLITEYILFYCGNKKFNLNIKSINYLKWSILQFPYIFIMGISSFFTNYLINWKSK